MTKTFKIRFFAICIAILLVVVTLTMAVSANEEIGSDETMIVGPTKYVTVAEYDYTTHTERTYQMSYTEYEFTSTEPELETLGGTDLPNSSRNVINGMWIPVSASQYSNYPYSAICSLYAGSRSTAFIVGKRIAMTSAHCVYTPTNGWDTSAYLMPHAPQNVSSSYIINNGTKVLKAIIPTAYKTNNVVNNDWAILIVEDDIGTANGTLPLNFTPPVVNNSVYVIGYPKTATINGTTYTRAMIKSPGSITSVASQYVRYNCDTINGSSGSPVIWETNTNGTVKYNVVVIHSTGHTTDNSGHRIDQFLYQAVRQLNGTYQ